MNVKADSPARIVRLGPLVILPMGEPAPEDAADGLILSIEASTAFGTGAHTTTRLCLERIAELPPARRVLDVGTGTGILALTALLLGAERAVANDVDPAALIAARANAERNGLGAALELYPGDVESLTASFDLILANIRAPELMRLAMPIVRCVDARGTVLLSGIRESEAEDVERAYRQLGLRALARETREGWTRLELLASW